MNVKESATKLKKKKDVKMGKPYEYTDEMVVIKIKVFAKS